MILYKYLRHLKKIITFINLLYIIIIYDKEKITDQYDKGKDMYANCVESHERVINTIKELCGEKTILIGGMHKLVHSGNLYNKFLYTANWVDLIRKNDLKTYTIDIKRIL